MRKSSWYNWTAEERGLSFQLNTILKFPRRNPTPNQSPNQWFQPLELYLHASPLYTFFPLSPVRTALFLRSEYAELPSPALAQQRKLCGESCETDTITQQQQPALLLPVNSMDFQMQKGSWCLRTNLAVAGLHHGWLLAWKFIHMNLEYNTWHKIYRGCHAPIPDKNTAVTDGGTRHLSC